MRRFDVSFRVAVFWGSGRPVFCREHSSIVSVRFLHHHRFPVDVQGFGFLTNCDLCGRRMRTHRSFVELFRFASPFRRGTVDSIMLSKRYANESTSQDMQCHAYWGRCRETHSNRRMSNKEARMTKETASCRTSALSSTSMVPGSPQFLNRGAAGTGRRCVHSDFRDHQSNAGKTARPVNNRVLCVFATLRENPSL